jgi:hypothetical protein
MRGSLGGVGTAVPGLHAMHGPAHTRLARGCTFAYNGGVPYASLPPRESNSGPAADR